MGILTETQLSKEQTKKLQTMDIGELVIAYFDGEFTIIQVKNSPVEYYWNVQKNRWMKYVPVRQGSLF